MTDGAIRFLFGCANLLLCACVGGTGMRTSPDEGTARESRSSGDFSGGKSVEMLSGDRVPLERDWDKTWTGSGRVKAILTNGSAQALVIRIRDASDKVVAQASLDANGSAKLSLPPGRLYSLIRMVQEGRVSYYKGPEFEVPENASEMQMTLQSGGYSNLQPIDAEEFNR